METTKGVYWCARDLSGSPVGNHHFALLLTQDPSDFDSLDVSGLPETSYEEEDKNGEKYYFYTFGGSKNVGATETGRLVVKVNEPHDVKSVREGIDPDEHTSPVKADYDIEAHKITELSHSDFQNIINFISNYYSNQLVDNVPLYAVADENCSAWVNSLLKALGISQSKRESYGEFDGIDWGEEDEISELYFKLPKFGGVTGFKTSTGVGVCKHPSRDEIGIVFKGESNSEVYTVFSEDGFDWSADLTRIGLMTNNIPAMCQNPDGEHIILGARSTEDDTIYVRKFVGGASNVDIQQATKEGIAMCQYDNKVYVAFKSSNSDDLYLTSSSNGDDWSSDPISTDEATSKKPSICEFNGALYMAFRSSNDDTIWSKKHGGSLQDTKQATKEGVASCSVNGKLYIAFKSSVSDDLYLTSSSDGVNWPTNPFSFGHATKESPAMCEYNGKLFIAFKDSTNNDIRYVLLDPEIVMNSEA